MVPILQTNQEVSDSIVRKPRHLNTGERVPDISGGPSNATVSQTRIAIKIPGTPITLTVTSLGDPIPSFAVEAGLTNALREIQPTVKTRATMPIPNHQFWYRDRVSHLWFLLMASSGKTVTWEQLSWTMAGLLHWMENGHCQELAYEVEIDGKGHAGFGNVGYDALTTSTFANETFGGNGMASLYLPSTDDCFEIPDMGTKICMRSFGQPIPISEVNMMFTDAIAKTYPFSHRDPNERVPDNVFRYTKVFSAHGDRVSFILQVEPRATIVWFGLYQIWSSLWKYMKGTRPNAPGQQQHLQALEFDLISVGEAKMATGRVLYYPGQIPLESVATG